MVKGPSVSGDPHEGKRLHTAISAAALKLAEIESDTPTVSTGELLAGLFRHARGKFSALKMERGMLLHPTTPLTTVLRPVRPVLDRNLATRVHSQICCRLRPIEHQCPVGA